MTMIDPADLATLSDPTMLAACGVNAPKALLQARRRNRLRREGGSVEPPFPAPLTHVAGAALYRIGDVVAWHQRHTRAFNPSRPGWRD